MKTKLILFLIVLLGAFLRFYHLDQLPGSFTPDEVAQGYTAYSILHTGHDEWGNSNIFSLRSFGDFKPPLQTFLMIPSVKLFGLTPFAIRLPNVVFSTLAIFTVYLFASTLTQKRSIGLISALLLAISPWHLPMSRLALEANLTVFLLPLASWLLLISRKNKLLIAIAGLLFGINLFSYHAAKLFTPVYLFLFLGYIFVTTKQYKKFFPAFLTFAACVILLFVSQSSAGAARTSDIAIFNPTDHWQTVSAAQYTSVNTGLHPLITRLFNNKAGYVVLQLLRNYMSVFSPQFLLTQGAGETTYGMLPGFGVLGLAGFVGFVFVIYHFIKSPKMRPVLLFLLLCILVAAVPASMAKSNYSANRLSTLIPFIQILSAVGLYHLFTSIASRRYLILIVLAALSFDTLYFLQTYYYQGNSILADGMLYGHKEVNEYITSRSPRQVIYSRKTSEPQAYVMFFQKIDPVITQAHTPGWLRYTQEGKSFVDQMGDYQLDKYFFRELNFVSDQQLPDAILVGRPEEIPISKADRIIYAPDPNQAKPLFVIYDTSLHQL